MIVLVLLYCSNLLLSVTGVLDIQNQVVQQISAKSKKKKNTVDPDPDRDLDPVSNEDLGTGPGEDEDGDAGAGADAGHAGTVDTANLKVKVPGMMGAGFWAALSTLAKSCKRKQFIIIYWYIMYYGSLVSELPSSYSLSVSIFCKTKKKSNKNHCSQAFHGTILKTKQSHSHFLRLY